MVIIKIKIHILNKENVEKGGEKMILKRERQNVFLLLILSIVLFNLVFPMNVVFAANEGSGGADNVNVKVTGDDNAS